MTGKPLPVARGEGGPRDGARRQETRPRWPAGGSGSPQVAPLRRREEGGGGASGRSRTRVRSRHVSEGGRVATGYPWGGRVSGLGDVDGALADGVPGSPGAGSPPGRTVELGRRERGRRARGRPAVPGPPPGSPSPGPPPARSLWYGWGRAHVFGCAAQVQKSFPIQKVSGWRAFAAREPLRGKFTLSRAGRASMGGGRATAPRPHGALRVSPADGGPGRVAPGRFVEPVGGVVWLWHGTRAHPPSPRRLWARRRPVSGARVTPRRFSPSLAFPFSPHLPSLPF